MRIAINTAISLHSPVSTGKCRTGKKIRGQTHL